MTVERAITSSSPRPRTLHAAGLLPWPSRRPWWTHSLVRVGILICTSNAEDATNERMRYESLVKSFRAAMSAEPFGNRGPVVEAAEDLAHWADELVKNRPHTAVDKKRAWTMLAELCDESATKGLDYDSARQIGWAFRWRFIAT